MFDRNAVTYVTLLAVDFSFDGLSYELDWRLFVKKRS
jgi:hypothetical protein